MDDISVTKYNCIMPINLENIFKAPISLLDRAGMPVYLVYHHLRKQCINKINIQFKVKRKLLTLRTTVFQINL